MDNFKPEWAELLKKAVEDPGTIAKGFALFHRYSIGNQILIMEQCYIKGIAPGPVATYKQWKELGRQVKKGAKALYMQVPCIYKAKKDTETQEELPPILKGFRYQKLWFVLSETEGLDFEIEEQPPKWDSKQAMKVLAIQEIPFSRVNGNIAGYARGRELAINPIAEGKVMVRLHEMAHIVLGHTENITISSMISERNNQEVEAESVAFICGNILGLPCMSDSTGAYSELAKRKRDKPCYGPADFWSSGQNLKSGATRNQTLYGRRSMRCLCITHLTSDPYDSWGMLYDNYQNAVIQGVEEGKMPRMTYDEFYDCVEEWASQVPLTEGLEFVDNLLVNFDYYAFLFN